MKKYRWLILVVLAVILTEVYGSGNADMGIKKEVLNEGSFKEKDDNSDKKNKLKLLIIEALPGLGIGHLCFGWALYGCIKLVVGVLPCLLSGLGTCNVIPTKTSQGCFGTCMTIFLFIFSLGYSIWWVADIFLIYFGIFDNKISSRNKKFTEYCK